MSAVKKTIAVCVISYNQREYLIEVIDSLLAQTRMPDQIVVIDDLSSDGSDQVLRQYKQDHPALFTIKVNETNLGIGANRHRAVKESRCDLTTYVDGDDLYYPRKLELEEQCLIDNPNAGFAISNFDIIDSSGDVIRKWAINPARDLPEGDLFDAVYTQAFQDGTQCRYPLTDTRSLVEATSNIIGMSLYDDLVILMHLSRKMTCAIVQEVSHAYRLHDGCVHRSMNDQHYKVLRRIYLENNHLLQGLEPARQRRLERTSSRILSLYAWRAIKDHSRSPTERSKERVIELAKDAMHLRPSTIRPKHALRILATQLKSAR